MVLRAGVAGQVLSVLTLRFHCAPEDFAGQSVRTKGIRQRSSMGGPLLPLAID